ncbi:hypothetical protein BJ322DRAFT_549689 [Thelephora terrestris]|uniref:DUF6533 domain-containing protein n=1 Tax=Thelephora terrestris TaxID=56493 RepID=A0A9P6LAS4_9AGAM|nr:hypothetical protein BJ322DRAFT_549689 [Thelephora terrestris]
MPSIVALQTLIDAGFDIMTIKYYVVAGMTLLFFDYLLTLPDEIRYAWRGRKPWTFYPFLLNRYLPVLYEIWVVFVVWWPGLTDEVCNHTAWMDIAIFVFLTLMAQMFLTLRIYALTMKNKMIMAFFSGVTISQLALGIYLTFLGATNPAVVSSSIPLDAFRLCSFEIHRLLGIGYASISIFFDLAAFSLIIGFGRRTGLNANSVAMSRPSLVHTIVHDATVYFFFVFTSQIIFLLTLIFGRVGASSVAIGFISVVDPFSVAHYPGPSRDWDRRLLTDNDRTPDAFPQKGCNR